VGKVGEKQRVGGKQRPLYAYYLRKNIAADKKR
jgi:hypothetical protein